MNNIISLLCKQSGTVVSHFTTNNYVTQINNYNNNVEEDIFGIDDIKYDVVLNDKELNDLVHMNLDLNYNK